MAETFTRPTPLDTAPAPVPAAYDRDRWEAAVLSSSDLSRHARLLALILAHRAGPGGVLPAGGSHTAPRLARQANMQERLARESLNALETDGYVTRPDVHTWQPRGMLRPVTLTLPSHAVVRQEPPHPGGPA